MDRLHAYTKENVPRINAALEKLLPHAEITPGALHEAMRYSVLSGGKRIRSLLCLMSAEVCGGTIEAALPAACAVELVHNYSLIHDDLPAMDNSEMRRGKLTCHKAFGEALAILAGNALLTLAFEVLAEAYPDERGARAGSCLAKAAGHVGMVGGQVLDLEGEGAELEIKQIQAIDRWKTGALITAACQMGSTMAGGGEEALAALSGYGRALGLAFQITDDLLDLEVSLAESGKSSGQDAPAGKLTYPAALGAEGARELAREQGAEAKNALKDFGKAALMLRLLADLVVERKK